MWETKCLSLYGFLDSKNATKCLNVGYCASALSRLERYCEVLMSNTTTARAASANGCSRDCRAGSLCYSLSTDLDSSSLYTHLLHDVVRANDAVQVDVTIFTSTGRKTRIEKPWRLYLFMPTRNLALGAERSRALCGSIVDPAQM